MNGIQRHEAVRRFHNDSSVRIMIAGLKVGGQALNLTCANRVISSKFISSTDDSTISILGVSKRVAEY